MYEMELSYSLHGCCYGYICMKHCDNFNVYQLGPHYIYHGWLDGRLCFGKAYQSDIKCVY